jgi:hypothetical protein
MSFTRPYTSGTFCLLCDYLILITSLIVRIPSRRSQRWPLPGTILSGGTDNEAHRALVWTAGFELSMPVVAGCMKQIVYFTTEIPFFCHVHMKIRMVLTGKP